MQAPPNELSAKAYCEIIEPNRWRDIRIRRIITDKRNPMNKRAMSHRCWKYFHGITPFLCRLAFWCHGRRKVFNDFHMGESRDLKITGETLFVRRWVKAQVLQWIHNRMPQWRRRAHRLKFFHFHFSSIKLRAENVKWIFIKWNFTPKKKEKESVSRIGSWYVFCAHVCRSFFWMQSRYKPKVMPMNFLWRCAFAQSSPGVAFNARHAARCVGGKVAKFSSSKLDRDVSHNELPSAYIEAHNTSSNHIFSFCTKPFYEDFFFAFSRTFTRFSLPLSQRIFLSNATIRTHTTARETFVIRDAILARRIFKFAQLCDIPGSAARVSKD